ncbi:PD40 domain-containing protein [Psychrobacter sp. H7-1]|uniref:PD40 domain-containing protein n=1 Tax=Psychrobacter sp. H7-1 TaxID=1569265 RepID=UPI00191B12CD|nr:PD40 domain-containing protein [Psychrobacter sp. H7-1]
MTLTTLQQQPNLFGHTAARRSFAAMTTTLLISLLGASAALMSVSAQAAEEEYDLEATITKKGETNQNQVAFVPFAGDSTVSSLIENNLQATPLKITSQGLIGQPHSRDDLAVTLPAWQQLGIPYLVIGSSKQQGGNTSITFEVIEVAQGRIIKGTQMVQGIDKKTAANKAAGRIYELLTGKPIDLNARLVYVEEKGSGKSKTSSLILSDADGSNKRLLAQVIDAAIYSPAISPDGRFVAYSVQLKDNSANLWKQDLQTRQLTRLVDMKGSNLSPSFSPDGSKILFSSTVNGDSDIYRVSSQGGKAEQIISLPYDQLSPSYASNGSFVFVSDHASPNRPNIYRYSFSGSPVQISRGGYAANPSISPDGTKIGYLSGRSAAIMSSNGSNVANYGATGIDAAPKFSPTGERVVYSQGTKNSNLVIRYVDGGKTITLPTEGVAKFPVWVPSAQ